MAGRYGAGQEVLTRSARSQGRAGREALDAMQRAEEPVYAGDVAKRWSGGGRHRGTLAQDLAQRRAASVDYAAVEARIIVQMAVEARQQGKTARHVQEALREAMLAPPPWCVAGEG